MPEAQATRIRDFIYLDVPKVYSLYSQVFKGVTQSISEEQFNQITTGDTQRAILRGSSSDSEAQQARRRTESIVLHDYVYTHLEEALDHAFIDPSGIPVSDLLAALRESPLVRAAGWVEIEDYERLNTFMRDFNDLAEAIAYSTLTSDPNYDKMKILRLLASIRKAPNKNEADKLRNDLNKLTDAKQKAIELGLLQDPNILENLQTLSALFNPQGYDVLVTPPKSPSLHLRGSLDKAWLRYDPQILSSQYGGQSNAPWTIVGLVTHVQGEPTVPPLQSDVSSESSQASTPSSQGFKMLDGYRTMFRAARVFERSLLEGETDTEVVLSPLAIYREFSIPPKTVAAS